MANLACTWEQFLVNFLGAIMIRVHLCSHLSLTTLWHVSWHIKLRSCRSFTLKIGVNFASLFGVLGVVWLTLSVWIEVTKVTRVAHGIGICSVWTLLDLHTSVFAHLNVVSSCLLLTKGVGRPFDIHLGFDLDFFNLEVRFKP